MTPKLVSANLQRPSGRAPSRSPGSVGWLGFIMAWELLVWQVAELVRRVTMTGAASVCCRHLAGGTRRNEIRPPSV
jgi:hypothetical protein